MIMKKQFFNFDLGILILQNNNSKIGYSKITAIE